jgi:tRNA threonylcarbamoyladenosine biosynthesis protein TsaE
MRSKKSKPTAATRSSRSSVARTCSERELREAAAELARAAESTFRKKGVYPRVILEGPMGAGKSTFARAMLDALGVDRASEGSPTFAIAHEYRMPDGSAVVHADGYRLRSDAELEATGLIEILWDPSRLVLFEWMDLFPETKSAIEKGDLPHVVVSLAFSESGAGLRELRIESDSDS